MTPKINLTLEGKYAKFLITYTAVKDGDVKNVSEILIKNSKRASNDPSSEMFTFAYVTYRISIS